MNAKSYMLDTDTFSCLVSGRHPKVRLHVAEQQKHVVLSSISLAEALFGARKTGSRKYGHDDRRFGNFFRLYARDE